MTRALICTGVLGGGTAVVFVLALAVSIMFPQGSLLPAGWSGGWARTMLSSDQVVQQGWAGPGFDGGPLGIEPAPAPQVDVLPVQAPPEIES